MYEEKKQVLGISNQEKKALRLFKSSFLALHLHKKPSFKGVPRFPSPAGLSLVSTLP